MGFVAHTMARSVLRADAFKLNMIGTMMNMNSEELALPYAMRGMPRMVCSGGQCHSLSMMPIPPQPPQLVQRLRQQRLKMHLFFSAVSHQTSGFVWTVVRKKQTGQAFLMGRICAWIVPGGTVALVFTSVLCEAPQWTFGAPSNCDACSLVARRNFMNSSSCTHVSARHLGPWMSCLSATGLVQLRTTGVSSTFVAMEEMGQEFGHHHQMEVTTPLMNMFKVMNSAARLHGLVNTERRKQPKTPTTQ
mmetsp:Transcript_29999/g.58887  ORF Transcript_29999/g.58887 Transcript_29999/m.58887 type:complete len:247 (-) Transcript_29999:966-1706(-)